jgi:hypothetical protein
MDQLDCYRMRTNSTLPLSSASGMLIEVLKDEGQDQLGTQTAAKSAIGMLNACMRAQV